MSSYTELETVLILKLNSSSLPQSYSISNCVRLLVFFAGEPT